MKMHKEAVVGADFLSGPKIKTISLYVLMVFALAITSYIKVPVPFSPVPLTLQTLVVLLAGGLLGARAGALTSLTYILVGLTGMPVFAGNVAGLTGIAGPTGGYLVGFVVAAFFTGWMAKKVNYSLTGLLITTSIASGIILVLGALHLSLFLNVGASKAVMAGIVPFILGDMLKAVAAAFIIHAARKRAFLKS